VITILAVGGPGRDVAAVFGRNPSVEVITARDVDDALEKLARNRRVDAVLLLDGASAAANARTILAEDPGAPPLYAPESAGAIPGMRRLPDSSAGDLVAALAAHLESEGTR
jgi:hypothetical protein